MEEFQKFPSGQNEQGILKLKEAFFGAKKAYDGDLIIKIPEHCLALVHNQKVMNLCIDLIVLNPKEVK
jgi:hypothetical protein